MKEFSGRNYSQRSFSTLHSCLGYNLAFSSLRIFVLLFLSLFYCRSNWCSLKYGVKVIFSEQIVQERKIMIQNMSYV